MGSLTAQERKAREAVYAWAGEDQEIDLGTNWSAGDSVTVFTPDPEARKLHIKGGTASSPDETYGSLARFSRTISIPEASFAGDGGPGLAAVYGVTKVLAASDAQGIGVYGGAVTSGTHEGAHSLADGVGLYGFGRALAGSTRTGMGLFANGRREDAGAVATGAEIAVDNETETAGTHNKAGASGTKGIFLHPVGTADSGTGLQIGHPSTAKFEVGIGVNEGSVTAASFRDDSTATRSVLIKGTHEKAAVAVASGAGPVIVGNEERNAAGEALLEVYYGESSLDPGVVFGTGLGKSCSITPIRNSSVITKIFATATAGAFLTGTGIGDTGINFTAGKTFHIGAATKTSLLRVNETGVGLNGAAPVAKAGAITSPAAELAALKTAVDAIRVALTNVGITA